ncbi:MAG: EutN/CcmL family microcompartment protein [Acidobacteria bacterium]|nr:EutN/CcmL family microcompartment protein [Acidobacteriota bacterium]
MIIGQVVGNVTATQKNPRFEGAKLLLVQPLTLDGNPQGDTVLAIDGVDAGVGDRVLVVLEGWSAAHVLRKPGSAVDAAVIGVIDEVELFSRE